MSLDYYPVRLRSRTLGDYRFGSHRAHLYAEIESPGPITYEYLLEVRSATGALELVVSAEASDLGTRCIGGFSAAGHANYPVQERIIHAADFKARAFAIVEEWVACDLVPSAASERLGPNVAPAGPERALPALVALERGEQVAPDRRR